MYAKTKPIVLFFHLVSFFFCLFFSLCATFHRAGWHSVCWNWRRTRERRGSEVVLLNQLVFRFSFFFVLFCHTVIHYKILWVYKLAIKAHSPWKQMNTMATVSLSLYCTVLTVVQCQGFIFFFSPFGVASLSILISFPCSKIAEPNNGRQNL